MSNRNESKYSNLKLAQLLEDIASLKIEKGKNSNIKNINITQKYQDALGHFCGSEQDELIENLLYNIQPFKKLKQDWDDTLKNSANLNLTDSNLEEITKGLKAISQNTLRESRLSGESLYLQLKCVELNKKLLKLESQLKKEINKRHRLNIKTKQKSEEKYLQDLFDHQILRLAKDLDDSLDKIDYEIDLVTSEINEFLEKSQQAVLNHGYFALGRIINLYFHNFIAPVFYKIKYVSPQ